MLTMMALAYLLTKNLILNNLIIKKILKRNFMKYVIPMAGKSSRFSDAGFKIPKYLIEVKNKTLIEYSVDSLPIRSNDEIIFIVLNEHERIFNVTKIIKNKFKSKKIQIISIKKETRGQSETVMFSRNYIDEFEDLVIFNIDTCFYSKTLIKKLQFKNNKKDGIIGSFYNSSNENHWSFANINKEERVIKVVEKEKISNYALTGLYHFSESKDFFETAENHIRKNKLFKNEFYVAPLYNDLILNGKSYVLDIVEKFIPLGTPEEILAFEKS